MNKIKYLSHYVQNKDVENRICAPSAKTKIDYIAQVLNRNGYFVEMISASRTANKRRCFHGKITKLTKMQSLKTFFTFPTGNIIKGILRVLSSNILLFVELMKLKKNEKIIVYHSLCYMKVVDLAHKIKRFHLILEVEEIYADVTGKKKLKEKEVVFLESADSYIFSTKLLDKIINKYGKPSVVVNGTYQVEKERDSTKKKETLQNKNRKIIHCVYAGTLDSRKGGAAAAVYAARFLSSNYHVHILGFGSESEIRNIQDIIGRVKEKSEARISYDGLLLGEEYIRFIQNCDIGLSTQSPESDFNSTSFPSKILSYMSNNLRVVCIRIPAVELSAIGNYIFYYDKQTPEDIANAIRNIDLNDNYDSREILLKLDMKFKQSLKEMMRQ